MLEKFHIRTTLDDIIRRRKGEVKLGERFRFLPANSAEGLAKAKKSGTRFALMGVPESIGILANSGTSGAESSWQEFLFQLANQQSNRFLDGSEILCLGQVETRDLQSRANELNPREDQYLTKLRSLCQELDQRVAPVIAAVIESGLVPVVIGGGHNNAFPIIQGVCQGTPLPDGMGCINLDAHADFRPLEGRHSGNGFSYAFYKGFLKRYHVSGINQQAISETMLKNIDLEDRVAYTFLQPGESPDVEKAIQFINQEKLLPTGLEIDLDALAMVPTSAYSVSGYTVDQARLFIRKVNQEIVPVYLHLAEGQATEGRDARIVARVLAVLAMDFIKSYPV